MMMHQAELRGAGRENGKRNIGTTLACMRMEREEEEEEGERNKGRGEKEENLCTIICREGHEYVEGKPCTSHLMKE